MCCNTWERDLKYRDTQPLKELILNYYNNQKTFDTNEYQGFNIMRDLILESGCVIETYEKNSTINQVIEYYKSKQKLGNTIINRKEQEPQYTSPTKSQLLMKDGRTGYVFNKNIKENTADIFVIDKDNIMRRYTFDRTQPLFEGWGLIQYKSKVV